MCVLCDNAACQCCHPQYGRYWFIPTDRQGWTCPKCQRVNGPHVDQCPCSSVGYTIGPSTTTLRPGETT